MSYSVTVEPDNYSFSVGEGESILDAALRHGHPFPYGCRDGACGSCRGKIINGQITYGDEDPPALTEQDKTGGMALFCQARPLGDIVVDVNEVRTTDEITVKTVPCRVSRLERLSHDVMGLWLSLPKTQRLQFFAGQYIDILLREGRHRSFSLANAPHNDEFLELHIRHYDGGVFSDFVFTELHEKSLLRVRGPLGTFFLREDSERPIIIIAGGTGFAPAKGIMEHILAEEITRPVHLYWGVRALRDLYMAQLPADWAAQRQNIHYTPVLSDALPEDDWNGRQGFVHQAVLDDFGDLGEFDIYASGPPVMVKTAAAAFRDKGMDPERFFSDAFEFAVD